MIPEFDRKPDPERRRTPQPVRGSSVFQSALDRIRTYGLLLRRQPLYPLSYEGKDAGKPAGPVGLKKLSRSGARCENVAKINIPERHPS